MYTHALQVPTMKIQMKIDNSQVPENSVSQSFYWLCLKQTDFFEKLLGLDLNIKSEASLSYATRI